MKKPKPLIRGSVVFVRRRQWGNSPPEYYVNGDLFTTDVNKATAWPTAEEADLQLSDGCEVILILRNEVNLLDCGMELHEAVEHLEDFQKAVHTMFNDVPGVSSEDSKISKDVMLGVPIQDIAYHTGLSHEQVAAAMMRVLQAQAKHIKLPAPLPRHLFEDQ